MVAHTGVPGELPRKHLFPGSTVILPGRTVAVLAADVRPGARLVAASPVTPDESSRTS